MRKEQRLEELSQLLATGGVVDMGTIRKALGGVSAMTAFRYLRDVPYRRSYNHNGRYYSTHDPARYDRRGLWTCDDVHFSKDGSLRDTVLRLVQEATAGTTHQELQARLKVRVQNALLDLYRKRHVERERLTDVYLYLHIDPSVRDEQLRQRREQIEARGRECEIEVSHELVIEVLLVLIRHPGSTVGDVVRHLRGHSPPIKSPEVSAVFDRYELGEKGGS